MEKNNKNWLEDCLDGIEKTRVAVFGDFCLDAYWLMSDDDSEVSVETGLPVRRVIKQEYSLGGAANIVDNLVLAALMCLRPHLARLWQRNWILLRLKLILSS